MIPLRTKAFLARLQAELPLWVERGWVAAEYRQVILDHVAEQTKAPLRYLVRVLGVMGALLFGAGVISFFAANWGLMPKAAKLALLLGALGGSYTAAGFCFARTHESLGQALLLLAVLLFGANIFLIAQIYHIDAHYPSGVLVWALGALITAFAVSSQPVLVTALALTVLWSGMETLEFDGNPHWQFFLPWAVALGLVCRDRAVVGFSAACAGLLAWCLLVISSPHFLDRPWVAGERVALWQLFMFAGISLYIVARGMSWYPRWSMFASPVITTSALLSVTALFVLTFPEVQRFETSRPFSAALPLAWLVVTVAVLAGVAGLMIWRYRDTQIAALPLYRQAAFVLLLVAGALAFANLVLGGRYPGWIAFGYNLLGFAGVVWLVLTGIDRAEARIVNLGFALFGALLLARYIDTFWTLLDRSYFFMAGGALLLFAGYFLERSRKRLTTRMRTADRS